MQEGGDGHGGRTGSFASPRLKLERIITTAHGHLAPVLEDADDDQERNDSFSVDDENEVHSGTLARRGGILRQ